MSDSTTATTPNTAPADLGSKLVQDVAVGATAAVGDAVNALDQWLETHVSNGPLGQNPALVGLIGSAFTALRSLLV